MDENAKYCNNQSYFGEYCRDECSNKTINCRECFKVNGTCTQCEKNFYKQDCTGDCSLCPNGNCSMDGNCKDQINDCEGNTKKGDKCDIDCSEGTSDYCEKCKRNGTCTVCKGGNFWGDSCEKPCSDHCPDNFCMPDGNCTNQNDNCYNNLTFEEYCLKPCNESHNNCETCDRKGNCLSCLGNNTYGSDCEGSCENCPDRLCEFNGTCLNQKDDCYESLYIGPDCNETCSTINESCATCARNGTCLS
jgi:hypothetical protein